MDTCALVLAGGDPVDAGLRNVLPDAAFVVAADSGLHLAEGLGLKVDRIVGDLDSADLDLVDAAVAT
ncbi:MAG: thiamine diphosphokinase, partial [Acidimicrobiia bacterium]